MATTKKETTTTTKTSRARIEAIVARARHETSAFWTEFSATGMTARRLQATVAAASLGTAAVVWWLLRATTPAENSGIFSASDAWRVCINPENVSAAEDLEKHEARIRGQAADGHSWTWIYRPLPSTQKALRARGFRVGKPDKVRDCHVQWDPKPWWKFWQV